jgi:WhiB family redox-sensing transcriptional regulator
MSFVAYRELATGGVRQLGSAERQRGGRQMQGRPDQSRVVEWVECLPDELGTLADLFDEADEQEWQERALCAQTDPEAFFPEKGGSTREAKRICQGCEVRAECLEYALAHDERFGIWGGLSERERRKLKKRAS